jgi:CrcB protein
MVKLMLLVGLGGFIGTILRFLVARFFMTSVDSVFPWGTFVVNILGSLLIGIFLGLSEKGNLVSQEWNLFLTVGICGGFTTFSSFSNEGYILLQNKEILRFATYASLSFFLGLLTVFLGRAITKLI